MADIIPDPAVYEAETAQALQAYQNALSAISARRANTLQNYGFTAQVDPTTGQLQNYSIDSHNQFGALQQMLGQHQVADQTVQHADVARGIGTVGLGAQQLARTRLANAAQTQGLGRQFVGEIGSEASDQLSALQGYNEARVQAQRDALLSAIQNGFFTPVQQDNGGMQTYSGGATSRDAKPTPVNVKGTKNANAGFFALNPVAARGI